MTESIKAVDREQFLRVWRAELKKHVLTRKREIEKRDFWEGVNAVREIHAADLFEIASMTGEWADHWKTQYVLDALWDEMEQYIVHATVLVSNNKRRADLLSFLGRIEKILLKERRLYPNATALFDRYIGLLQEDQLTFKENSKPWKNRQSFWARHDVLYRPGKAIFRRFDWDGVFQIRIGQILRLWLTKNDRISARTISRLVVLFYFCCGLAVETKDGKVHIVATNRELTVDAVDQKLSQNGLFGELAEITNIPPALSRSAKQRRKSSS